MMIRDTILEEQNRRGGGKKRGRINKISDWHLKQM